MQAPESQATPSEESLLQFLIFRIGSQNFMIEIHRVQEVMRYRPVTPIPAAPSFVEGMIELRGKVVTVVDLRSRLGMPEVEPGSRTRILVFRSKRANFGVIVDAVERVMPVSLEDIQPPPEVPRGAPFILGVVKHDENLYLILDLERILTTNELLALPQLLPSSFHS
jgi:purine-binding chemotaxis protein CheW